MRWLRAGKRLTLNRESVAVGAGYAASCTVRALLHFLCHGVHDLFALVRSSAGSSGKPFRDNLGLVLLVVCIPRLA